MPPPPASRSTPTTPTPGSRCCGSRCATTVAGAPTPTVDPGWSGSKTAWKPSAAAFCYTAHPAPAPRFAPNSHSRGIPGQMTAIIVPAQGRDLLVQDVQLEQKHLNSIKELKLVLPEDNS